MGQGIGQQNLTVDVVEHGVHQSQTVCVVNQLAASEGLFPFKLRLICIQIVKSSVCSLTYRWAAIIKPKVPQAGSLHRSPARGFISRVITSMRTRGVKYWPAPDFSRWRSSQQAFI